MAVEGGNGNMRKNALSIANTVLLAVFIFSAPGLAEDFQRNIGVVSRSQGSSADFQRTYTIVPGSQIRIWTISGNIKVQGYDGQNVVVEGFTVGRDRDSVEILDTSGPNRVDLGVRYAKNCGCDASVDFQVRVPRAISYNFDRVLSVSGNVSLADVTGRVKAESTSGDVMVKNVSGIVSASTTSGSVDVYISKIEGSGNMRFSSTSGSVRVKAPANLDAIVDMSTISGSLTTDFPINVLERRYGPGRSAHGQLGAGTCSIRITSVSGRVSLTKG
jgi:hypothetical protein